ncbi:hypothetical protein UlMin_015145 [Ulmus minor]
MERDERKKRKIESEEDEKVEEFFALIRSTREALDSLRGDSSGKEKECERNKAGAEKPTGVWNPTFQPEDFLVEDNNGKRSTTTTTTASTLVLISDQPGPSNMELEQKEKEEEENIKNVKQGDDELDLNLSL